MPIRYFFTDGGTFGVTSSQLQQALQAAFASWDPRRRRRCLRNCRYLANPTQDGATVIDFRTGPISAGTPA
jgi:hypothetical protein